MTFGGLPTRWEPAGTARGLALVVPGLPADGESEVFSDLEREVMAYAEAMTATPPAVTDEMVASLDRQLGHAAVVELTMMVAVENERSRFNSATGLASPTPRTCSRRSGCAGPTSTPTRCATRGPTSSG